jgi:hypothetical protein
LIITGHLQASSTRISVSITGRSPSPKYWNVMVMWVAQQAIAMFLHWYIILYTSSKLTQFGVLCSCRRSLK